MGRYEGGSPFLEKRWYLLIKFYSTLQSAASYELWDNCGVCVCACVWRYAEIFLFMIDCHLGGLLR